MALNQRTIADLRKEGVIGIRFVCAARRCRHPGDMSFDVLALPDDLRLVDIARWGRVTCEKCGSSRVTIKPAT